MKRFRCVCGSRLFFENTACLACGNAVAFEPSALEFVVFDGPAGTGPNADGFRHCRNRLDHHACNWAVGPDAAGKYCRSCATNDLIPALEIEDNRLLWFRLEQAKRRLLYSLLSIGLPFEGQDGRQPLRFRFLEDQRRNPDVKPEYVATGHHAGVITVNLAEADDVERTSIREQMRELYRTPLGHLRHEAGHYFLEFLIPDPGEEEFRGLFGDVQQDYANAMDAYYRNGPAPDWQRSHISAYASAHPHEDWAESFAHYLHITETLETWPSVLPAELPGEDWIDRWMSLSLALNEMSRSLGADPPYPFVLTGPSVDKLRFVNRRLSLRVGYSA